MIGLFCKKHSAGRQAAPFPWFHLELKLSALDGLSSDRRKA